MITRTQPYLLLVVALLMVFTLFGCQQQAPAPAPEEEVAPVVEEAEAEEEAMSVAFVLHGTVDDGNWNGMAYQGILNLQEAGFDVAYSESVDDADVAKVLRDYASQGADIIWAWSGTYPNAVLEVAPEFPDTTFAAITGPGMEWPDNVWAISHEFEDAYFLSGALAGLMSETGKVGQVGGIPIPIYAASQMAFEAGVLYVNPDAEVFSTFVGDFNDPVGAKQAAAAQIENGADIVASSVDLGVYGLFEAAREAGDVKIMTLLSDQYENAPDVILGATLMDYPGAIIEVTNQIAEGARGGYHAISWAAGTAYWSDFHGQIPDDVMDELAEVEAALVAGEIDYPTQADLFE